MNICFSSGHGQKIRGASCTPQPPYLDEVNEARKVVDRVAELWKQSGVGVRTFHDNTSTSQGQNLDAIVNWHNAQGNWREYDVSCHFNAYAKYTAAQKPNGMGTEVLHHHKNSSTAALAKKVSGAISGAGNLINRGAKPRDNLKFLNGTAKPAILLEVCFVDAEVDGNRYRQNFEKICVAIAESISGVKVPGKPVEPPIEPPVEPPTVPTERNRIEVVSLIHGDLGVSINGVLITGDGSSDAAADLTITKHGDVLLVINGEEFHNYPEEPAPPTTEEPPPTTTNLKTNITATVFQDSSTAYSPFTGISDTEISVALPANITDANMRARGVLVRNPANGKEAVCQIRDKGPWMVDDSAYVFGTAEAISVTCFNNKQPLPRGPRTGQIPTNDAAIDLSPGAARAIGISGKGKVDWRLVEDAIA